jgi:hypothetical protein
MRALLAGLLVLGLLVAPAAAEEGEPHITDICGDGMLFVSTPDQTVTSPDPFSPRFDVKSADFRSLRADGTVTGVELTLQVCEDAAAPENHQEYSWHWGTEAGCTQRVVYTRARKVSIGGGEPYAEPHVVTFREECPVPDPSLLSGTVTTTFSVELAAADVVSTAGDTVRVVLRRAELPEQAAGALADGTRFVKPWVIARMLGGPTSIFVRDPEFYVLVTSGVDTASGDDWVVGS